MIGGKVLLALLCVVASASSARAEEGLLFSLSANKGVVADHAEGAADTIFALGAKTTPDGATGPGLSLDNGLTLAWSAPGNIYAQRGTLAFSFRPREPLGSTPFPIFRVAPSDSSSWDMAWLRIDWNGHGFDAFVTDTNLARTRVSFKMDKIPAPDQWVAIAFAWDQQSGVRLWVDGKPVARNETAAVYDSGLYGFGPFQRIVSPHQVHSMYNFRRSGDMDEIRIYDRTIDDAGALALAQHAAVVVPPHPLTPGDWAHRYGWDQTVPPYLSDAVTRVRKVEFTDARDLKERMFKGTDGIRETTWPGVYNRSRLPGRHDYFELPDWNVYSEGGRSYRLSLPDEPWNRIEITGAAYGALKTGNEILFKRPKGAERTTTALSERRGGEIQFDNTDPETPIQEIAAYEVTAGTLPNAWTTLSYTVDSTADAALYPALDGLQAHIAGRFVPEERQVAVALPKGAPRKERPAVAPSQPVVHILIPADFRTTRPGQGPTRFSYGWENMAAGLDGIVLDLPAMTVSATNGDLLPLNIRIHDPNWPDRDLLDINVSVKPGEARTLWLDTRDRILRPEDSLYLTIAAAGGGFNASSLNGMKVRLVFKSAADAKPEHIADRLEQARDNLAFLVEEQPNIRAYPLFDRFERDISDVLAVDPDNAVARSYWVEKNPEQPYAPFTQAQPPAGVPLWAFRQIEDLKLYRQFVDWWIDNRQVANGEFGGGLSDDTDLVNQWVPLALMGVEPDRLIASQRAVLDATYANGMWTGGLSRIRTDELHSYEEGINAVAEAMQMNWGNPSAIERGMAVAREYPRLFETNAAGHRHLVSAYFSGSDIDREGIWGWQKPFGFLITHPGLLLVDYNGAPETKKLLLDTLDSWLAHGKQAADGSWTFPSDIEWATDKSGGRGVGLAVHAFWAAYTWTGDSKYLRPIEGFIRQGSLGDVSQLNADLLSQVPGGAALADRVASGAVGGQGGAIDRNLGGVSDSDFADLVRWQRTGDTSGLERLYAQEIASDTQRMPVLTEAHLWTDRVSVPNELLQRTRLGGVAHRRNAFYPGHLVSWRFAVPATGEDVAILIPQGDPKHFHVIGYNLSAAPVTASMMGAQLTPGQWQVSGADNRRITLEQGKSVDLVFPPHQQVDYEFTLIAAGEDPSTRPDIGVESSDLSLKGRRLTVRVHSLGAKATPPGTAIVEDANGKAVATVRFGALAAPTDLLPKTADVTVNLLRGLIGPMHVRLELDGDPQEITDVNNKAVVR